ncbi:MAG: hypothetical protein RBR81_09040 [Bacteroidales bacterium]|jgi:hypothetical protein|nr:hypothetical protein [Bacteroidales bacterium]
MKPDIQQIGLLAGQTYSYLALRKTIGWIGILLPFVLMFGTRIIFKEKMTLFTISLFYYSGMRDVFVGALCAIALFMFFYRGYDKWDNRLGNIAGICALCTAWFPTTESGPQDLPGKIHFTSAAILFTILAAFSLFLFTRKVSHPTTQKLKRNRIYIICGLVMIVCLLFILTYFIFLDVRYPGSGLVFWAETFVLVAFGISWLTKGGTLYPDPIIVKTGKIADYQGDEWIDDMETEDE